ncbi:MAG: hypothetical protein LUE27_06005 [Clostridia bacterium]|nr:hypothetical protein [Clostridia bacterium]MCD8306997.1 hypothetical protein [Clostridia bacterium]
MNTVKGFISNKKPGWYVEVITLILGLITVIVYTARGGNYLSAVSSSAVTLLALGIVTSFLVLIMDFRFLAIIPMILYASAVAVLLNTEMMFISNVAFGVDNNVFDSAWYTFIITGILAMITSAVAFGMGLSKKDVLVAKD